MTVTFVHAVSQYITVYVVTFCMFSGLYPSGTHVYCTLREKDTGQRRKDLLK